MFQKRMSLHCIVLFQRQSAEEDASRARRGPEDRHAAHAQRRRRIHADHQRMSCKKEQNK